MKNDFDFNRTAGNALREAGSLVVQGLMYGFGYLPPGHTPLRDRDVHTLVFVHGLGATRASLYPLQGYMRTQGFRRQLSFNYRTIGSIESCAMALKEQLDEQVKGGRIDIIAHSMGGLVSRVYLQKLGGARRVSRLVTLGTPHLGTHATAWAPIALVRQMSPESPFIQELNALPAPEGVQVTTIAGGSDLLVLPPSHCRAPFGTHHHLEGVGHTGLMLAPRALNIVREAIGPCVEGLVGDKQRA